jgi:hypothetical protein
MQNRIYDHPVCQRDWQKHTEYVDKNHFFPD